MARNDVNVRIGAQDKTAAAFKSAESRMKSLAGSAKSMAAGFGLMLGTRAITGAINDAVQYGSALTDAATATNTNIQALQVFRAAARDAGAEQSKMDNAMIRAHKAGVDAANGLSTYTRAFKALNIDVAKYNRMPTEQKLEAIASGMANAKDQNAAYAAAMDIMGTRNAPKLMEVLQRLGKDGYAALAEEIGKTNTIMDETDAAKLDAAADSIARMKENLTKFTGDKVAFWLQFFEAVENGKDSVEGLTNDVAIAVDEFNKWWGVISKIHGGLKKIVDYTPGGAIINKITGRGGKKDDAGSGYDGPVPTIQYAPTPVTPPAASGGADPARAGTAYEGKAKVGDQEYAIKDGEFVKISGELLEELKQSKDLQAQQLAIVKENNEQTKQALSQVSNARG